MTGRGWATNANAEKRTCPRCGRRAALIAGGDALTFCRWSRTDQCTLTLREAAAARLALLGDALPAWRRRDLEAVARGEEGR